MLDRFGVALQRTLRVVLTLEDLRRAEAAAADLDDPGVMDSAWR